MALKTARRAEHNIRSRAQSSLAGALLGIAAMAGAQAGLTLNATGIADG